MAAEVHTLRVEKNISKAGKLLHSLVPRAQIFCFYDNAKQCAWSSDSAEDYEIDNFVSDLPREVLMELAEQRDVLSRTLPSGRTVVALPVFDEQQALAGLLIALFSRNDGKSSSFNPGLLKNILEPAIDVIGESLRVSKQTRSLERHSDDVEKELSFVYDVDEKIHGSSGRHSSLAQLVGRSGRYLEINYSVLLIPSKRIRVSATHSSWKTVNRKVLDRYLIDHLLPKLAGQRRPVIFEIPPMKTDGELAADGYQALLCPVLDKQGNVEGMLAQLGRVDNSKFSRNDRRFMSYICRKVEYVIEQSFDAMTGLMNRSGFETQLGESGAALKKNGDAHQVIYFDLDNLQLVNDTFSREAGDEVILRFARLLEDDLPKSAVLSRLTGDDFCMLLTHAESEAAVEYAKEVRARMDSLRYLEGDKSLQVTMSVGIAAFTRSGSDGAGALTSARMACDSAKAHGRDRVEVFDEDDRSIVRRIDDMQLVASIQRALDSDEFELMAQPISALAKGARDIRYEVLLRMDDGDGGRVSTSALFSAAERYHMMPQIDRWVVSRSIAKLAEHREFLIESGATFAINLSGQTLGDVDILEFIESEIDNSGLPSSSLCFEITESAAVSNLKKAQSFINKLRKRGCEISLDDFGAGLSSFAYLKSFNVDTLKIDGGFIRDITVNRISESMVAAITQVANVMELKTVAEYVETKGARKLVKKLGVDFAQGHVIGKPLPLVSTLAELVETEAASTT
ncbi:MAG: EAL domain-containing protein [Gammaproteobacteria bacterium]|nr:EAL domain-containing protein [Gammaproteobacteria bacterium]